ncbi:ureidoglycolate amidohydrolase [Klebsormidium nitens]|uniref:Ureidoglycolate amidohydrolase n=1 Tax=Klebsormidium nitens TaxID=105231 RepID=A0A1Y1HP59_KLENI|nr:ureidoglycolate amidohydrolase [Klebsormidium nitens]|eukprot:GAQ78989.1 ureidoglycolate amidohydrolase [Klebsormidium nitens]
MKNRGHLVSIVVTLLFAFSGAYAIDLNSAAYPDATLSLEHGNPGFGASVLAVNAERLQGWIDHLATFSDDETPAVTRILFTDNDIAARRYVKSLMKDANLTITEDAVGNIYGLWEGSDTTDGIVGTGSHVDAIPLAGKYDGVLGVLGPIEAIKALQAAGFKPWRPIEVVMFTSEEPTRFGFGCLGSRVMSGHPEIRQKLEAAHDENGTSFDEAAAAAGYPDALKNLDSAVVKNKYSAFVELHIEQGPTLEEEGIPIGIVTAIAAPAQLTVTFSGGGGHAGATLMPFRNDAGLAAAELQLALEAAVLGTGSNDTVGTAGVVELRPGAVNNIRDVDGPRRDSVVEKVKAATEEIAERRKVGHTFTIGNQDPPATSGDRVLKAAVEATEQLRLRYKMMPSRAYHDSLFMARVAPTAMVFIPCFKGYSHRPDEFASKADMENGVRVLALTLAKLSVGPKTDCCH